MGMFPKLKSMRSVAPGLPTQWGKVRPREGRACRPGSLDAGGAFAKHLRSRPASARLGNNIATERTLLRPFAGNVVSAEQ